MYNSLGFSKRINQTITQLRTLRSIARNIHACKKTNTGKLSVAATKNVYSVAV